MDSIEFFKKNKYVYVPQLVSKDVTSFIYNYLVIKGCTNVSFNDQETPNLKYLKHCYGDICSETLLGILIDPLQKITQKKLCPTYSYTRLYTHGEILEPHTDRPSCQYSVTINFGGDPWSIFMGEPNKGGFENGWSILGEITMKPGDGIVYMGEDLVHWRHKFKGDHCAQAFLHYIDVDGPHYPEYSYDGRKNIGYRK